MATISPGLPLDFSALKTAGRSIRSLRSTSAPAPTTGVPRFAGLSGNTSASALPNRGPAVAETERLTATRWRTGSAHCRLERVPEVSRLRGGQLDDQAASTLERNAHDNATSFFGHLERTVARPWLHGGHARAPSFVQACEDTIIADRRLTHEICPDMPVGAVRFRA